MQKVYAITCIVLISLIFTYCKEPYDPPLGAKVHNFLVVEGGLNSNNGLAQVKLSRTRDLSSRENIAVINATVTLEGEDNNKIILGSTGNGIYTRNIIPFNRNVGYRLRIKVGSQEYLSSFEGVRPNVTIENVGWNKKESGVQLYVNASDKTNTTQYYRWEYEETWEFKTSFYANIEPVASKDARGMTIYSLRDIEFSKYPYYNTCWKSNLSSNIELGNSVGLTQAKIFEHPVVFIPNNDWRLASKYSLLVKQYGLSKKSFEYWQNIKKNSEQLGGLFSPQPSEIGSNIECLTNPEEPVVGYFDIASIDEKRIFISKSEVPDWNYSDGCRFPDTIPVDLASLQIFYSKTILPLMYVDDTKREVYAIQGTCVDCSLRGSPIKPSFWQ